MIFRLALDVLQALQFIHYRGIVHRDLGTRAFVMLPVAYTLLVDCRQRAVEFNRR